MKGLKKLAAAIAVLGSVLGAAAVTAGPAHASAPQVYYHE